MSEVNKYAKMQGNLVENVALWDHNPGKNWILISPESNVGVGYLLDGKKSWQPPALEDIKKSDKELAIETAVAEITKVESLDALKAALIKVFPSIM